MNVDAILEHTREIPENRRYWFLRTYGGILYSDFIRNQYIAIGVNDIPVEYLRRARPGESQDIEPLWNFIDKNTGYSDGSVTKFAHQVIDFVYNIKVGDIVLIPDESSRYFAVGEVETADLVINKVSQTFSFEGREEPYPEKRRRVKWLKTINSWDFKNDIGKPFVARSVLTEISVFGDFIESYISSFYIKNHKAYLALTIEQEEEINAFELFRLLESLTFFYKEFSVEFNEEPNEELYLKIKVQSKGKAIFYGLSLASVAALATLTILSQNNTIKLKEGDVEIEMGSDGLLKSYSDFLDADQERKMQWILFNDSLEALKASRKEAKSIEENVANDTNGQGEKDGGKDDGE